MRSNILWLAALGAGCVSFPHELPEGLTEETATPEESDTALPPTETATESPATESIDVVYMAYLHRTRVGAGAPPDTPEEDLPDARPAAHLLRLAFGTDPLDVPLSSPCVVDNSYCWNELPEVGDYVKVNQLVANRPDHIAADAGAEVLVNGEPAERIRRLSGERFFYTRPFPEPPTDNLRMHAPIPGAPISGVVSPEVDIPSPTTMRLADDRGRRELTPAANKVIFDWTPASQEEVVLVEVDSRNGPFHRLYRADDSGVFEFQLSDASASYGNRHFDVRVYRFRPEVHQVGDAEVHLTWISEDSFQVADNFECPVDITLYSGSWGGEISVTMTSPTGEVVYEDPDWGSGGSNYTYPYQTDEIESLMLVPGTYNLEYGESYGDAWNGGYFKIEQDGSEVYYYSMTSYGVYSDSDTYVHTCD